MKNNTSLPLFLVLIGAFFLFYNSNWSFNFGLTVGFIWPTVVILAGLILFMKKDRT
jgi:hypothetical protein